MSKPFSILVVCVGNVCRSPLAERLLRKRFDDLLGEHRDLVTVSSAGTRAVVGSGMDPMAEGELIRLGGDSTGFAARQHTEQMVNEADLVLTATKDIRSRVLEEAPGGLRRTFTLAEFVALANDVCSNSSEALVARAAQNRSSARVPDYDIADPIGKRPEVHAGVAEQIASSVDRVGHSVTTTLRPQISRP